ncbi:RGS domain-containing serine/threonine-protein kinase A-like isoform X2 [Acanthaster planci]|uniref:RGS domain-containing serine/threonine-protein kinase A-like isoform X2 n=1 Tax=Acanthaster planci TaxID=133434 RepID=A0A8B7ZWS9_ACAPL|nr:RGS domain-containing serine/threonine-protein kinase A-like isoform X2 [Acanthaster planci]
MMAGVKMDDVDEPQRDVRANQVLSDKTLRKISERLGSDWQKLASFLGFTAPEISNFKTDSQGQTEIQIFNMLVKWRQRQSSRSDQSRTLGKELQEIRRLDIIQQFNLLPDLESHTKDSDSGAAKVINEPRLSECDEDILETDAIFTKDPSAGGYNEINVSDIKTETQISPPDSRSKVYKAVWNSPSGPVEVAAKYCLNYKEEELLILSKLKHRHIVRLMGIGKLQCPPDMCVIVTQYAEKGSLYAFIEKHRSCWSEVKRFYWLKWALEGARGLGYLHCMHYLHGDVKSPNFVITEDDTLKICDFGSARKIINTVSTVGVRGSWPWMAPEAMGNQGESSMKPKVTAKSDVFSFAVVIWELLTGQVPFSGLQQLEIFETVYRKKGRLKLPKDCPKHLCDLLNRCWNQDYQKRPDMNEVQVALEGQERSPDQRSVSYQAPAPNKEPRVTAILKRLASSSSGGYADSTPLSKLRGIAISEDGQIAVTDSSSKQVAIYYGMDLQTVASTLKIEANDVAALRHSWVVVHPYKVCVYRMEDGKLVREFETEGDRSKVLSSVGVRKSGNIVIGDTRNFMLIEYNPAKNFRPVRSIRVDLEPHYLAVDSQDRLVISGCLQARVDVRTDLRRAFTIRPTVDDRPVRSCSGVCCDGTGIYLAVEVGDVGTGHILIYNQFGKYIRKVSTNLTRPRGLALTADGKKLAVADNHVVKTFQINNS